MMLTVFSCAYLPCGYPFHDCFFILFADFLIELLLSSLLLLLSFENSLYILDTNLQSDVWCANIPVCSRSFHFLLRKFHRAKAFNFDKVQFISISFYRCAFGVKSICLTLDLEDFSMSFSKCCIAVHFTLKSMTQFQSISVEQIQFEVHSLPCSNIQFYQAHFLRSIFTFLH